MQAAAYGGSSQCSKVPGIGREARVGRPTYSVTCRDVSSDWRTVSLSSTLQFLSSPSSHDRLAAAARFLAALPADRTALIVGATRAAADELAFAVAQQRGGVFGLTRAS